MADEQKPGADDQTQTEIIIDEDWKAQAQAEKERLEREAAGASSEPAKPAEPPAPDEQPKPDAGPKAPRAEGMPQADFALLVNQWAVQAMIGLGDMPNPVSNKREEDLDGAKFAIDMLAVIDEKTKGNLTTQEKQQLDSVLFQLRMQYVNASR